MACKTRKLSDIQTSCGSNIPSIKKMWIGNYDSATFTPAYVENPDYDPAHPDDPDNPQYITDDDGNNIIDHFNDADLKQGANYFVEFEFRKNTCSATSEMTVNDNGTHYFTNALNMVLAKQDTGKRLNIEAIASGDCTCIYLDGNNRYWVIGSDQPVNMTTVSATTGTAATDSNQYELVLSEDAPSMPIQLVGDPDATTPVTPESIITALCAA